MYTGRGSLMKDAVDGLSVRMCMWQRFWKSTHAKDYESEYFSRPCMNISRTLSSVMKVFFKHPKFVLY